jgi:hypothetical protein
VQRAVALLPWSQNILILSKELDDNATLYYAQPHYLFARHNMPTKFSTTP